MCEGSRRILNSLHHQLMSLRIYAGVYARVVYIYKYIYDDAYQHILSTYVEYMYEYMYEYVYEYRGSNTRSEMDDPGNATLSSK